MVSIISLARIQRRERCTLQSLAGAYLRVTATTVLATQLAVDCPKHCTDRPAQIVRERSAAPSLVYLLTQPNCDLPVSDALQFKISDPKASLTKIGNVNTNDTMWSGPTDDRWPVGAETDAVAGLDALRRLARIDLQVHYPGLGVTDTCA